MDRTIGNLSANEVIVLQELFLLADEEGTYVFIQQGRKVILMMFLLFANSVYSRV